MWHYLPALVLTASSAFLAMRVGKFFWLGVALFGFYALFSFFFFRDPPRAILAGPNEAVSPADGTIVGIEDLQESPYYGGPCKRVSIFLSVLSVHVNRAPFEGTVTALKYEPGRFKNALDPESSKVNEANVVWFDTPKGPVTVRQISGAVARRIVCPLAVGDRLDTGMKFGMIKLGSRTELFLPPDTEICVKIKEKVWAGTSVIARFQ